jgi:hypothetical protein
MEGISLRRRGAALLLGTAFGVFGMGLLQHLGVL